MTVNNLLEIKINCNQFFYGVTIYFKFGNNIYGFTQYNDSILSAECFRIEVYKHSFANCIKETYYDKNFKEII